MTAISVEPPTRIMVVDDDETQAGLLSQWLTRQGYQVEVASSGEQALEMIHNAKPDLMLLDIEMPGSDGLQVCRQIQQMYEYPPLIIFLTGQSSVATSIEALDVGGSDFITKPFRPAQLEARLRAALRLKSRMDGLADQVARDALTGLWNRHHLESRVAELVANGKRHGETFSLIMMDIDKFKRFNDSHGHSAGDAVLRKVAERMLETSRQEDLLFRIGGEEFLMLMPDSTPQGAHLAAERLRTAVADQPISFVDGHNGTSESATVTISVGVATWDPDATIETLVQRADRAMYEAKEAGRNQVVTYD